jgi:hypothetical protein
MEKPISLKTREFKDSMIRSINTSGLPLIVIEPILKDILSAVQLKLDQEYLQDKENYEKSLAKGEDEHV